MDAAVDGGAVWVNAAGNYRGTTWFGKFRDLDGDSLHDFYTYSEDECNGLVSRGTSIDAGHVFQAQFRWEGSWDTTPATDLDILLMRWDPESGSLVQVNTAANTFSRNHQAGFDNPTPFEYVHLSLPVAGHYCIMVRKRASDPNPGWIQLQVIRGCGMIEYRTGRGSIVSPAESANSGMLAVSAYPYYVYPSQLYSHLKYSSSGTTPDGRTKPDITGADHTLSATAGGRLRGTSVGSAHVAGLAALVKQRYPTYMPEQVVSYLKNHALGVHPRCGKVCDLPIRQRKADAPPDNTYGYGIAHLPNSSLPPDTSQQMREILSDALNGSRSEENSRLEELIQSGAMMAAPALELEPPYALTPPYASDTAPAHEREASQEQPDEWYCIGPTYDDEIGSVFLLRADGAWLGTKAYLFEGAPDSREAQELCREQADRNMEASSD